VVHQHYASKDTWGTTAYRFYSTISSQIHYFEFLRIQFGIKWDGVSSIPLALGYNSLLKNFDSGWTEYFGGKHL
jgi:hypothetical protein